MRLALVVSVGKTCGVSRQVGSQRLGHTHHHKLQKFNDIAGFQGEVWHEHDRYALATFSKARQRIHLDSDRPMHSRARRHRRDTHLDKYAEPRELW